MFNIKQRPDRVIYSFIIRLKVNEADRWFGLKIIQQMWCDRLLQQQKSEAKQMCTVWGEKK